MNEIDVGRNKQRFKEIVESEIQRDGIQNLMRWLETSDFYSAPASTQYHNACEGGLCDHSLGVYDALIQLNATFGLELKPESMAIAALFHDLCKVNVYVKTKRNQKNEYGRWEEVEGYKFDDQMPLGHGEKSVFILQNSFLKLTLAEMYAIRWHMGGFDNSVKGGERGQSSAYEKCPLAAALHLADMAATYFVEDRG